MRKITPFLWFDGKAEEAMNFYTSIFRSSKIGRIEVFGMIQSPRTWRGPMTSRDHRETR